MAYSFKITGLGNKDELVKQEDNQQSYRLYKFTMNDAPDGIWVLLFQQVAREYREVTLSGNKDIPEIWATASPGLSVKHVLRTAARAVRQANDEATANDEIYNAAAREKAAAAVDAQSKLAAELDELDFDNLDLDSPIVPASPDERTEPIEVAEGGAPLTPEENASLFKLTPEGAAEAAANDGDGDAPGGDDDDDGAQG